MKKSNLYRVLKMTNAKRFIRVIGICLASWFVLLLAFAILYGTYLYKWSDSAYGAVQNDHFAYPIYHVLDHFEFDETEILIYEFKTKDSASEHPSVAVAECEKKDFIGKSWYKILSRGESVFEKEHNTGGPIVLETGISYCFSLIPEPPKTMPDPDQTKEVHFADGSSGYIFYSISE